MPEQLLEILSRLKAGDQLLFRQLFNKHYGLVCQTTYRILREKSLAEDLAQNVFIKFWEKRDSLNIQSSIPAYLRQMAVNEALAYLRKEQRKQKRAENAPQTLYTSQSVEDQYLTKELDHSIRKAIMDLSPKCQEIFMMSRYEELTYREIAERLDISIKTVENQMGKALRLLRVALQQYIKKN